MSLSNDLCASLTNGVELQDRSPTSVAGLVADEQSPPQPQTDVVLENFKHLFLPNLDVDGPRHTCLSPRLSSLSDSCDSLMDDSSLLQYRNSGNPQDGSTLSIVRPYPSFFGAASESAQDLVVPFLPNNLTSSRLAILVNRLKFDPRLDEVLNIAIPRLSDQENWNTLCPSPRRRRQQRIH